MPKTIEEIYEVEVGSDFQQMIEGARAKRLAPFVLFDAVRVKTDSHWGFGWHAHSGVATLTYIYAATLNHEDSSPSAGVVNAGGIQWMQAGGGIWHKEMLDPIDGFIGAHQLWVQLPPEEEEGENCYFDVAAQGIPKHENTKVMMGCYGDADAGLDVPADITYLDVTLKAGESWHFDPPASQVRGFIFPRKGSVVIEGSEVAENAMGVFVDGEGDIDVTAKGDTQFVLALTALPTFPMVRAYGQVHTNKEAMQRSTERIQALEPLVPK